MGQGAHRQHTPHPLQGSPQQGFFGAPGSSQITRVG